MIVYFILTSWLLLHFYQKTQVIGLVDQLLEIVVESKDQSYIKEKALYCISSIASYLASEAPSSFIHVSI